MIILNLLLRIYNKVCDLIQLKRHKVTMDFNQSWLVIDEGELGNTMER